ncbi:MAG: hypothetical protein KF832_09500 [Caldilineaceae bacterium]|nr:hypothetical protein [Caldilineaceae bacterium]
MQTRDPELIADAQALQKQLRQVYWIGGGSGAGKSTIARHLATELGLHYYATDDVMADHAQRSTAESCPLLHAFIAMTMDERWVNRSPEIMLATFHWFQGEGFRMIVDDLLRLPTEVGVVVEGFRLLPAYVKPLLTDHNHAVWLLPTPAFRQTVFAHRGGIHWSFIGKTSDPERALSNLLTRDALFTRRLENEAKQLKLNVINVDSTLTVDDLTNQVKAIFGL